MEPKAELTLDEMLADPIVRVVMRRDGVEETHVRDLVRRVARGLVSGEPRSFAAWPRGGRPTKARTRWEDR